MSKNSQGLLQWLTVSSIILLSDYPKIDDYYGGKLLSTNFNLDF